MKTTILTLVMLILGASLTGVEAADESVKSEMEDMAYVEGGTFQMGDVFDGGVRFATPVHEVTVSSFYLNKYEVTVEEFTAFVKDASYVTSAKKESKHAGVRANDEYSARLAIRGTHVLALAPSRSQR